jgi:AcrR family transcriptional regulator
MPKIVDHAARRAQIVDAVIRVVHREGYAGVSVRSVAAEADWSTGAIRHYFGSQQELLAFAMSSLAERAGDRIATSGRLATDVAGVARLLEEVLPLDATRRAESEMWMALAIAARTDPELTGVWRETQKQLRGLMESCVLVLAELSGRALDLTTETDRLQALIDGLALHGTLEPRMSVRRARAALRAHLVGLTGSGSP